MNYNTLCLKLSSCLHSSTLTSLSTVLFTFLSASLLYASLPPCLSSQLLFFAFFFFVDHFPPPLLLDPPLFLFTSFYSDSIYFDIYLSFSFPFCSFFMATPPLIYSLCARFASSPPSLLAPSHLRHTHLALPFIASGGWRATVSFNPSQCHLQTLTVTQRLHRCLTIKAMALSKAGRGVITAAARQIEPCLIWLSAHK